LACEVGAVFFVCSGEIPCPDSSSADPHRDYERLVPQQTAVGEAGEIDSALTGVLPTVVLGRSYVNPVVSAQPLFTNGGDTAVVRTTAVQEDRFTLCVL
jgi:hypothetical protein